MTVSPGLTVVELPHLTPEQRKTLLKLIGEPVEEKRLRSEGPQKIFISLCERKAENLYLVEQILDPFLTMLSFEVHYWIKDRRFGNADDVIYAIMDSCDAMIALYTNDDKVENNGFKPSGNVVLEMGRDKPKNKVILCEEGTIIESMAFPKIPSIPFKRKELEKLLVDLLRFLKNSGFDFT
jgi:hypothetical protein